MDDKPNIVSSAENTDFAASNYANTTSNVVGAKRFSFDAISYFIKQVAIVVISVTFLVGLVVIFWANSNGQTSDTSYKSNNTDKVAEDVDDIDLTPSGAPVSNIKSTGKILDLIGGNTYKSDSDESITSGWKQVSIGLSSSCGVKFDDKLYCWGSSAYTSALGQNGANDSNVPLQVDVSGELAGKEIKLIASGYGANCAITTDGKIYCWGTGLNWNKAGWGGSSDTPTYIDGGGIFKDKSMESLIINYYGACASASDNLIYCWGNNGWMGQNFAPTAINASGVLNGKTITHMASKNDHSCVSTSDQKIFCWYNAQYGTLNGRNVKNISPVEIDDDGVLEDKQIIKISAGETFDCLLTDDSDVYCWGYNNFGNLGNNSKTSSAAMTPVNKEGVLKSQKLISITSGDFSTCALSDLGKVYCWGNNKSGQLGNKSNTESLVPVAVYMDGALSGKSAKAVMAYDDFICVIADGDNELYCWGTNEYNQISSSSSKYFNEPIKMFTD